MKVLKEIISYVIIIAAVILVRTFVITPVIVDGTSMIPTLLDNQVLLLYKLDKKYQRFDIVVVDHKVNGVKENLVKRVIGLPGEYVEYKDSKLYINKEEVEEDFIDVETSDFALAKLGFLEIPEGKYFVVGDNRGDSSDSRILGLIPENEIKGKIVFSIFPFNRFGTIKNMTKESESEG